MMLTIVKIRIIYIIYNYMCFLEKYLGIRELMDAAATLDREVAPHIWGVPEVQLINNTTSGLEPIIRIF